MRAIRVLATLSLSFALAVFTAHYILPSDSLAVIAAVSAAVGIIGIFIKNNFGRRIIIIGLAAACGFLIYHIHYERVLAPCEAFTGDKLTVSARVTSYPDYRSDCILQDVKFCDEKLPQVSGLMIDYDSEKSELIPGDDIEVTLKLNSANMRYNSEYDANISKGLYLMGSVCGKIEKTGRTDKTFLYFPQYIGKGISEKIDEIFPDDTAYFMKALLIGDKSEYYAEHEDLSCAMSIAGLSHIVAVSGMHVAFLVGFLQLILGKNRKNSLVCIVLVWLFVITVGAPASAIRAGFMQTLLLMAPLFNRENDDVTSLSFALALILFINPFACGNFGLQLSFAAMAGIVMFGDKIFDWLKERLKNNNSFALYILGIVSSSAAVSVFTVPIAAVQFGYVSVLSAVSNIFCLWAVTLLFCGGYLCCAVGYILPTVAKIAASIISYLVWYIELVVKYIARMPFAALYTENPQIVFWLILAYALFIFCYVYSNEVFRPLVPLTIAFVSLAAVLVITRFSMTGSDGTAAVMDVGNGQCIALTYGDSSVVVDCGSAGTMDNAGSMMSSYMHSQGRNHIDALLLTHLHSDHAKGVVRLLNTIKVKTIIMPATASEHDENGLYEKIMASAVNNGTDVIFVDSNQRLSFGNIVLNIYDPSLKTDKNESGLSLTASLGEFDVLITGDVSKNVERQLLENEDLSDTDLLIVGHHGSKNSCCQELLQEAKPKTAVISVGFNNYGHPSSAVLERLRTSGADIYRTDLMGRIVIKTA